MSERESIYVFKIDDRYLFTPSSPRTRVPTELRIYSSNDESQFEVPEEDFPRVLELLEQDQYKPIRVENIEEFIVVTDQGTEYGTIHRNSVIHWDHDGSTFFVMQTPQAVETAVDQEAIRLTESDLRLSEIPPKPT